MARKVCRWRRLILGFNGWVPRKAADARRCQSSIIRKSDGAGRCKMFLVAAARLEFTCPRSRHLAEKGGKIRAGKDAELHSETHSRDLASDGRRRVCRVLIALSKPRRSGGGDRRR